MNHSHDRTRIVYPHGILIEGMHQSAATMEYIESKNTNLSFCGMVQIPHGFTYVPKGTKKPTRKRLS